MDYDPRDDARKSYELAIEEKRKKLESFPCVRIGDAQLFLGDCLELLPLLPKVDAVVTSPPYMQQRNYGRKITDWKTLVSGCLTQVSDNAQILCNLGLIYKDGECLEYWNDLIFDMRYHGWRLFGWYVWDQLHGQTGDWNGRLAPAFEFIFHFNKTARKPHKTKPTLGGKIHGPGLRTQSGNQLNKDGSRRKKSQNGKTVNPTKIPDAIVRCARETSPLHSEHPARFPVKFAKELVEPYTSAGEVVLDPFMGSGTTGVACAKLGRRFIGIELEPKYFQIACKRIQEAYAQPDMFVEPPAKPEQTAMDLAIEQED